MKISVKKNQVKEDIFDLNFSEGTFVATPLGVFFNLTRDELTKLADFANNELQDSKI